MHRTVHWKNHRWYSLVGRLWKAKWRVPINPLLMFTPSTFFASPNANAYLHSGDMRQFKVVGTIPIRTGDTDPRIVECRISNHTTKQLLHFRAHNLLVTWSELPGLFCKDLNSWQSCDCSDLSCHPVRINLRHNKQSELMETAANHVNNQVTVTA